VREVETGFLVLMVCGALYLQTDPTIWSNLSHIVVRLIGWSWWWTHFQPDTGPLVATHSWLRRRARKIGHY